jgi:hypothetical protein
MASAAPGQRGTSHLFGMGFGAGFKNDWARSMQSSNSLSYCSGYKVSRQIRTVAAWDIAVGVLPDGSEIFIGDLLQHRFQLVSLQHEAVPFGCRALYLFAAGFDSSVR